MQISMYKTITTNKQVLLSSFYVNERWRAFNYLASKSCISKDAAHRTFFSSSDSNLSRKYEQRLLVGWSPAQFFNVVARVEDYYHFVPWCRQSTILRRRGDNYLEAELEVGFQILKERYTSQVSLRPPSELHNTPFTTQCGPRTIDRGRHDIHWAGRSHTTAKSISNNDSNINNNKTHEVITRVRDSMLFKYLDSSWRLDPGPVAQSSWMHFKIDYAFRSKLHSYVADAFFSEVAQKMTSSFQSRCAKLYGPSSLLSLQDGGRGREERAGGSREGLNGERNGKVDVSFPPPSSSSPPLSSSPSPPSSSCPPLVSSPSFPSSPPPPSPPSLPQPPSIRSSFAASSPATQSSRPPLPPPLMVRLRKATLRSFTPKCLQQQESHAPR